MPTFRKWGEEVKAVLPTLERVATENGLFLNAEAAYKLLDEREFPTVYAMLQGVCEGLSMIPTALADHERICGLLARYPHEEHQ
jgi:hypothetical protein